MTARPDLAALIERLRNLASGRTEWRVQHPVEKCYCISFDRSDNLNPERAAREWLADHKGRFPGGQFADYEVAEVRWFSELERAALEAADALEALRAREAQPDVIEAARKGLEALGMTTRYPAPGTVAHTLNELERVRDAAIAALRAALKETK